MQLINVKTGAILEELFVASMVISPSTVSKPLLFARLYRPSEPGVRGLSQPTKFLLLRQFKSDVDEVLALVPCLCHSMAAFKHFKPNFRYKQSFLTLVLKADCEVQFTSWIHDLCSDNPKRIWAKDCKKGRWPPNPIMQLIGIIQWCTNLKRIHLSSTPDV